MRSTSRVELRDGRRSGINGARRFERSIRRRPTSPAARSARCAWQHGLVEARAASACRVVRGRAIGSGLTERSWCAGRLNRDSRWLRSGAIQPAWIATQAVCGLNRARAAAGLPGRVPSRRRSTRSGLQSLRKSSPRFLHPGPCARSAGYRVRAKGPDLGGRRRTGEAGLAAGGSGTRIRVVASGQMPRLDLSGFEIALDPLEIRAQAGGVLIAQLPVFLEARC